MTAKTTERPQPARKTARKNAAVTAKTAEPLEVVRKTARTRAPAPKQDDVAVDRRPPDERAASGKAVRAKVPLESHADFQPKRSRNPVGLLLSQVENRVADLVPIRHGRMLVSPFSFYRGAALVMAARSQIDPDVRLANPALRRCTSIQLRSLRLAGASLGVRHQ